MTLSADKRAYMVFNSPMPDMLTPLFGRNAEEELDELRLVYPEYTRGKRQVLPATEIETYLYCQAASAHWAPQYDLAKNRMRFYLGDAEYGTDPDGNVIVSRRIGPRKGFVVEPGITDSICKERG